MILQERSKNTQRKWNKVELSRKGAARTAVNPPTRETIQIPAKKVPKFTPRKGLREKVK